MEVESLKNEILSKINLKEFFSKNISRITGKDVEITKVDNSGWSNKVPCCFHDDDRPSLNVNTVNGGFKCFSCNEKGDIIDFWAKVKGLSSKADFVEVLADLANQAGIEIKPSGSVKKRGSDKEKKEFKKSHDVPNTRNINKADNKDERQEEIPLSYIKELHNNLGSEHYKYLTFSKGLTASTIKKNLIGYHPEKKYKTPQGEWKSGRYSIPVLNKNGETRNVRYYTKDTEPEYKMINEKEYGSPPRLFFLYALIKNNWDNVIICEGEFDCLLLNQELENEKYHNWGAVCGTHGAGTFEDEWLRYLHNKNIYFLFDVDEAGKSAASSHCIKYFISLIKTNKVKCVKNVELPLDGSSEMNDVSDYFLKAAKSVHDLIELIDNTEELQIGGLNEDDTTINPVEVESFIDCIKDRRYIDKRVRVPVTISGQSSKTYHSVRSYEVSSCAYNKSGEECCSSEAGERIISYGHDLFIQSCMLSKRRLDGCLKSIACKHPNPKCSIRIKKKVVMEEYFAHQVINRWRAEENEDGRVENVQELVTSALYVLQPEINVSIRPQNYIATGWVRSHPNTQQATLFVESLETLDDDWKSYKITDDSREKLKFISEINTKTILKDLSDNVTRIYDSNDILLVVLLSYVSPLWISFNNEIIHGWINSAIIGDSGTGKSATYMRMSDYINLGDLFSVLTGTRTGLLYSLQQRSGGEWFVKVGRYIQANEKIIAVDETQECQSEEIKKMAKAMDEGWIDISQVASGGYTTMTRTLFLLNPRGGKTISDYSYGCEALGEVFDPMFIRRLDIAVFCTSKEDYRFYNKRNTEKEALKEGKVTSDILKNLIYWAWTRRINDIKWSDSATQECLNKSSELSDKYGQADDIPLINPADFRNNLARLSTSYAILDGNFTNDYSSVIVEVKHVQSIARFIDIVYSSISCNLLQHSKLSAKKKKLDDYEKIKDNFLAIINNSKYSINQKYADSQLFCQLILLLQQLKTVKRSDLSEQLSVSPKWIRRHISILQAYNLIEISSSGYKTTRKFNLFMQKWSLEEFDTFDENGEKKKTTISEMLDDVYSKIGENALKESEKIEAEREEVSYEPFDDDNKYGDPEYYNREEQEYYFNYNKDD